MTKTFDSGIENNILKSAVAIGGRPEQTAEYLIGLGLSKAVISKRGLSRTELAEWKFGKKHWPYLSSMSTETVRFLCTCP